MLITADNSTWTSGYIYIEYTENDLDGTTIGRIYVLRWEILDTEADPNTIWISGCSDGYGADDLEEAIEEYTKDNPANYFGYGSDCEKAVANTLTATTSVSAYSDFFEVYAESIGVTLPALP